MKEQFDASFYVLSLVGLWIFLDGALDSAEGREEIRAAFKDALLSAGSFEALQSIPEFQLAMEDYQRAHEGAVDIAARLDLMPAGPISVDELEVSPVIPPRNN